MTTNTTITQFRSALATVDPAALTGADRLALLDLLQAAFNASALTFGQAAAAIGVDVGTIRRWARTEQCPTIRDGRRLRVPAARVAEAAAVERVGQDRRQGSVAGATVQR